MQPGAGASGRVVEEAGTLRDNGGGHGRGGGETGTRAVPGASGAEEAGTRAATGVEEAGTEQQAAQDGRGRHRGGGHHGQSCGTTELMKMKG